MHNANAAFWTIKSNAAIKENSKTVLTGRYFKHFRLAGRESLYVQKRQDVIAADNYKILHNDFFFLIRLALKSTDDFHTAKETSEIYYWRYI